MLDTSFIIKVCGVTSAADAQTALDAGANALGFNFYPRSPRYLTPSQAGEIAAAVRGDYLRVGVFVNAPLDELLRIASQVPLNVLQLHGDEALIPRGTPYQVWRALPGESPRPETDYHVDAYLLDSPSPGSGMTFEWERAQTFDYRMIIAGGLDGANVAAAIAALQPWGVDACSRLEAAPGKKDAARVRAFVEAARAALERKLVRL